MIERLQFALRHVWPALRALPSRRWRAVFAEAWRLERSLPRLAETNDLPALMHQLTPAGAAEVEPRVRDRERMRALADAAVGLDLRSPLGLCLRQALVRYQLLRRAGVPVIVHFAARRHAGTVVAAARLTGHAWLELRGMPYAEEHHHYRDYVVTFSYPAGPTE